MKAVAEFVMRGRLQAALITVVGAGSMLFCWISAAVVALVTLRKGAGEGAWLLMWALLPAGTLLFVFADSGPLALLVSTMALAMVLRSSVSLSLAVLGAIPVALLTGLGLVAFGGQFLDQLVAMFSEFIASWEAQLSQGGEPVQLARPTAVQLAGMLGVSNASLALLCLVLARYWQAALFNPGGFGEEFRALRYPPALSVGMALGAIALSAMGAEYRTWAMIFTVPLTFSGLALVHARVRHRGQGAGWLTGFYLGWLLLDPVKLIVVCAAIADSWFDFRQRWVGPDSDANRD